MVILYAGLGITTILVLRQMSRRFREGGAAPGRPTCPTARARGKDLAGESADERKVPL